MMDRRRSLTAKTRRSQMTGEASMKRWLSTMKLTEAGARPTVGWGIDHFAQWPHVKNLVPHNSLYNFGRMQEVWLDR
jgi:hypothetical protein